MNCNPREASFLNILTMAIIHATVLGNLSVFVTCTFMDNELLLNRAAPQSSDNNVAIAKDVYQ